METNEYGYTHEAQHPKALTKEHLSYLKTISPMKEIYTYPNGVTVPIHPMCINCQARHFLKYQTTAVNKGDVVFDVKCKGVPGALLPGSGDMIKKIATEKNISTERAELLVKSTADPVAWAELMFGFNDNDPKAHKLRWYQKAVLRCSSHRIVMRAGRRSGKSFSMAVKLLYYVFNHMVSKGIDTNGKEVLSGPEIIITTPFQAQVDNLFAAIEMILKKNASLVNQVTTKHAGNLYIKSPYYLMEFANGASISGFVTGVEIRADGSGGGSLRGQNADIIYVDEMDMIPPDILDKVIIPILLTRPGTMFFVTSTPIGKAGAFYQLCKARSDFKEIYLPSTVLPHWDPDGKKEVKNLDPNDDSFIAEYMAEFIESSSGVFKAHDVYSAMSNYTYADASPDNTKFWHTKAGVRNRASDLVTVIGIDWNKNAGSEFVVICYDQGNHRWWVAEAHNVSPGRFNAILFKEEVWRLNYKWKPDYIYADEGYGHHIIDDLLYEAERLTILNRDAIVEGETSPITLFDQQKIKLGKRLKKFNFAQKVELTNPVDNTLLEKTGKEFLVENAIRVFEDQRIHFPASDNALSSQLLNYIVLRRSVSTNKPVYGMRQDKIGDHRLDALMLALGGLFLERNPYYSPNARAGQSLPSIISKETLSKRKDVETKESPLPIPGASVNYLKIKHGTGDMTEQQRQLQEKIQKRGDIRGYKEETKSVFEELWERTQSGNGYDNDTRFLYEGRGTAKHHTVNKPKIKSRGTRGGFLNA